MAQGITYEKNTTRAYIQRRRDKGFEPNADQIWQYIRSAWPGLTEAQQEEIFQACDKPIKRRT